MFDISNRRECFFGDRLVDPFRTTAETLLHHPVRNGIVMEHDALWEGDGCDYHNFFYDDGIYRMYYPGFNTAFSSKTIVVCYAESSDGIVWKKPKLGFHEWNGSYDNNILMDRTQFFNGGIDNFMVFKDTNPACTREKRYKAVARVIKSGQVGLHSYYSADGLHFIYGEALSTDGAFDSLNVAFWDEYASCYRCYFRGYHQPRCSEVGQDVEDNIRDIRYMESTDFITWM